MIRLTAVAVFGLAFAGYLRTLAPTITWRNGGIDSGELVTAIVTLGIPHPSGFPTYVLVGKMFSFLPLGDLAYRVNLMSAVFGALTAATLAVVICLVVSVPSSTEKEGAELPAQPAEKVDVDRRKMTVSEKVTSNPGSWAALTGALIFAFSPLFWSRATVAKEYTLHLWFVSMVLLCLIAWRRTAQARYLITFGIILGFAMGNHPTVLSVLPASLAFVGLTRDKSGSKASLFVLLRPTMLAVFVTAVAYSYLPIRAAQHPLLNWDDPANAAGFLAHITGSAYIDSLTASDPSAVLGNVAFAFRQIPIQYGWPACVCLLTGAWILASRDRPLGAFAAVVAGENILFAALYSARDSEVYLLPAYLVGSIAVGVGLSDVMSELQRFVRSLAPISSKLPWLVSSGLAALLVGFQILTNFALVDVSRDTTARDYAYAVLRSVEPGSVILTTQDATTFSLWYVWQALKQRPDVTVVDERLIDWDWYRESVDFSYPGLHLVDPTSVTENQLIVGQAAGRPVYRVFPPDLSLDRVVEPVVERVGP